MLISEMHGQRGFTISCEIFPPKPGAALDDTRDIAARAAKLPFDFISVTCGAADNTGANTESIARTIERLGVPALAHVTCVAASRDQTGVMLDQLAASGIRNVLALRGDLPAGETRTGAGHYRHASELVAEIKARGGFCVGGACYPEGHVESASQEEDLVHLKEKVDAGCDFLTTQMFFDNQVLYKFLYKLLQKNIQVPVLAGIMPVTNRKQIKRIVELSGTALPPRFQNIVDVFGADPAAMQQAGVAYATEQIVDLVANGVQGIHIYSMNRPDIAAQIMANLSHIIKK